MLPQLEEFDDQRTPSFVFPQMWQPVGTLDQQIRSPILRNAQWQIMHGLIRGLGISIDMERTQCHPSGSTMLPA
jgi:hypothetical protein